MKNLSIFLLFLVTTLSAVAQDCPRIFQRGDTLFTDTARQYQWFKDNQPIQGATQQWYLPAKKGNFSVQVNTETIEFTYSPVSSNKSIAGRIVDVHYEPIADAVISIGIKNVKSDAKGHFLLTDLEGGLTAAVVTITKDGFWKNTQRVHFFEQDTAVLTAMLEPLKVTNRFDAQKGATISERSFFLTLPPNSAVTESGEMYQGTILLSLKRSFPGEAGFGLRMPGGDFSAIDANGQEKILVSYGFMSAEMQGSNGEKLKLAKDQEATLEFYIPWEQNKTAPDSMPLWHFDEAAGVWKPEGTARKIGARYVGIVKHFSSWNCDYPRNRATVHGKARNCKNQPVPYLMINVGQRVVTANTKGEYTTFVPSETEFEVTANVDTVKITSLVESEEREIKDLDGSAVLHAVGLIDSTGTLTVYGYGIKEYSVDGGKTFLSKSEKVILVALNPISIARDSSGCEGKFRVFNLPKRGDCQVLEISELAQKPMYFTLKDAISTEETVYRMGLTTQEPREKINLFYCIQELNLMNNQLSIVPETIRQQTNLQILDLGNNQLDSLSEFIGQLTYLKKLRLSFNQLTSLPGSIEQLTNLQTLSLSTNKLTSLPESIGRLTNLQTLGLDANQLMSLPESIGLLTKLQTLYLSTNKLTSVPESIGQLTNLQTLSLDANQLVSLPESIGLLTNLQTLYLSTNKLASLPESIGQLNNLKSLWLSSNKLTSLSESIGQLSSLNFLKLDYNQLTSLPESIGQLTNLQTLEVYSNRLTSLPESIGLLTNLQTLNLNTNQLMVVPVPIKQLTNLRSLLIGSNQLTNIPEFIGQLINLKLVYLGGNELREIPEFVVQLTNLQTLNLNTNQLTSIPEFIGQLTNLQTLNLGYNQLTSLPASIANLKDTLKTLDLVANPITEEDKAKIRSWLPLTTITF